MEAKILAELAIIPICGLVGWLVYLGVCVFIVKKTGDTRGLRDLGTAAKAYRRWTRSICGSPLPDESNDAPERSNHQSGPALSAHASQERRSRRLPPQRRRGDAT
jgi:hypothetical protein